MKKSLAIAAFSLVVTVAFCQKNWVCEATLSYSSLNDPSLIGLDCIIENTGGTARRSSLMLERRIYKNVYAKTGAGISSNLNRYREYGGMCGSFEAFYERKSLEFDCLAMIGTTIGKRRLRPFVEAGAMFRFERNSRFSRIGELSNGWMATAGARALGPKAAAGAELLFGERFRARLQVFCTATGLRAEPNALTTKSFRKGLEAAIGYRF